MLYDTRTIIDIDGVDVDNQGITSTDASFFQDSSLFSPLGYKATSPLPPHIGLDTSCSVYGDAIEASTRSFPVHAASLVDPAIHSQDLLQLIDMKLSRFVVEYVVDCVSEAVDYALGRKSLPSILGRTRSPYHAKFTTFVSTVFFRAEVTVPTVLTALVYISRARPHLSIAFEEWALERVFLGALIAASKYTNDSTLKNMHWALCTGVFGKRDVGRIEREFLEVLDWQLCVAEADLMEHHAGLSPVSGPSAPIRLAVSHPRTHVGPPSASALELMSLQSSLPMMSPRACRSRLSSPLPSP